MQTQKFCEIYNAFYGEDITSPKQVNHYQYDGIELAEFCEFYFKQRLESSELIHFSSGEKAKYISIGMIAALLIAILLFTVIFMPW